MSKLRELSLSITLAVVPMAILMGPAAAAIKVLSSTAPKYTGGVELPDDTVLDVGNSQLVRLVKDGKTYEIAGPYTGTVDNYKSGCAWWREVLGKCSRQSSDDTGATIGATRGAQPKQ